MNENYKLIETEDGSYTIYLDEYSQAMHNISGAYNEALYKHVYPSKVLKSNKEIISVLDIGFGMGYNSLALLNEFKNFSQKYCKIIAFEKDRSYIKLLDKIIFNDDRDRIYDAVKTAFKAGEYICDDFSIKIFFGEARENIKNINSTFDAVFQDPFSPGMNPELWTVEFFKEIYNHMNKDGILTTYSRASHIRRGMLEAGFFIGKGSTDIIKKEGTLASKNEELIELFDVKIEIYPQIRTVSTLTRYFFLPILLF